MSEWFDDVQTRAILRKGLPPALAPPDAEGYSLLLLKPGKDEARMAEALDIIGQSGTANATAFPFVIRQRLSLDEAFRGQFLLACCDCATAFVRDQVTSSADAKYLSELYAELMSSAEFQAVEVELVFVPSTEAGRRFLWQFTCLAVGLGLPRKLVVMRKKARLLSYWAQKIGASVVVRDP
jgi:hypothetical protein